MTNADLPLEIRLQHARMGHLATLVAVLAVAPLSYARLGGAGAVLAIFCLARAVKELRLLLRTLRHSPGVIVATTDRVVLPRDVCTPNPVTLAPGEVLRAYVLRRTVSAAGSLLVVETAQGTFEYPRPWFEKDDDQTTLATALNQLARRERVTTTST